MNGCFMWDKCVFFGKLHLLLNSLVMRTLLLTLMVVCLAGHGRAQSDSLNILLQEGIKLHDAGDYAGAISKYDAIIAAHPDYFNAWYEKSFSMYQAGMYEPCMNLCRQILKNFPDNDGNSRVYDTYGSAADGLGQSTEAIKIYKEGIRKFPNFYLLPFNKGTTEYNQKEYDEATKDFETAIRLNHAHASSHQYLAYTIYSKNKIASAMALATFLLFEPSGPRAEKNLRSLIQVLGGNVQKKDDKTINITMSAEDLDTKGKGEDDFRPLEVMISLTAAANMGEKLKDSTDAGKLHSMLEILATANPKKKGFFYDTYVTLFAGLQKAGLLESAAHVMYLSAKEDYNQRWLTEHEDEVNKLSAYMNDWAKK